MNYGNQLYNGKTKGEIAEEAFRALGANATREQVDNYFRQEYKILKGCETSMYYVARGNAKRDPEAYHRALANINKVVQLAEKTLDHLPGQTNSPAELVNRTRQLAQDIGGYDQLLELVEALK